MDDRAVRRGRPGQPTGIAQRLHGAGAAVDPAAGIDVRSDQRRGLVPVQNVDRRAAPLPILDAGVYVRQMGFGVRRLDPAGLHRIAVDRVFGDQIEHQVGGAARGVGDTPAGFGAEHPLELARVVLQAWNNLAAVTAGRAPARFRRFQHQRFDAARRQVQRRGQAGEAAADNRHVRFGIAFQGRMAFRRHRGIRPKGGRQAGIDHNRLVGSLSSGHHCTVISPGGGRGRSTCPTT